MAGPKSRIVQKGLGALGNIYDQLNLARFGKGDKPYPEPEWDKAQGWEEYVRQLQLRDQALADKGALANLGDEPVDLGRREFLQKAPKAVVGGAGAAAGLGTAAALGAKALFTKGEFDDIISKVKSAFDENWQDISFRTTDSPSETLQKKLGIDDNEFAKISDDTSFIEHLEEIELDPAQMSSSEIATEVKGLVDEAMGSFSWDFSKGRGDNPSVLIDEFKIPAFKNEVSKQFPELDPQDIAELAEKIF